MGRLDWRVLQLVSIDKHIGFRARLNQSSSLPALNDRICAPILVRLLLLNCVIKHVHSALSLRWVFNFFREERQGENYAQKSDLSKSSPHLVQLVYLVRINGKECLGVLAQLDGDIWRFVHWIDHRCRDLTAQNGIQTEAAQNRASDQVSFRREVAPRT